MTTVALLGTPIETSVLYWLGSAVTASMTTLNVSLPSNTSSSIIAIGTTALVSPQRKVTWYSPGWKLSHVPIVYMGLIIQVFIYLKNYAYKCNHKVNI